ESLPQFAGRVRDNLKADAVQILGPKDRTVQRVAIVCGAGGELLQDVIRCRADAFLTGELRFHDYLTAEANNLALVLPGHYATERPGVEELAVLLQKEFPSLQVWASRAETSPTWTL